MGGKAGDQARGRVVPVAQFLLALLAGVQRVAGILGHDAVALAGLEGQRKAGAGLSAIGRLLALGRHQGGHGLAELVEQARRCLAQVVAEFAKADHGGFAGRLFQPDLVGLAGAAGGQECGDKNPVFLHCSFLKGQKNSHRRHNGPTA